MGTREVLALAKAHVDLERGELRIRRGKTKAARRTLRLTEESKLVLAKRMAGDSAWVFASPENPARHLTRLNGSHDRVCRATGLRFVLYDFRHTFATRMAQAGVDLATLAAILGHNSLRAIMKYVHPTAQHQREAMARYEGILRAARQLEVVQ